MMMPGRKYEVSVAVYRYSINGQEKERELNDNITTAKYWEYDSRIGRRWNVDPVINSSNSGYLTFTNNPVFYSDVNGNTVDIKDGKERVQYKNGKAYTYNADGTLSTNRYSGTNKFILGAINDLNNIGKYKMGRLYLKDLENSSNALSIFNSGDAETNNYDEKGSHTIKYSQLPVYNRDGVDFDKSFIKLGHEISHAWDWDQGKPESFAPTKYGGLLQSEINAVKFENYLRASDGEKDMRLKYGHNGVSWEILENKSPAHYLQFQRPLRKDEKMIPLVTPITAPVSNAIVIKQAVDGTTNGLPQKYQLTPTVIFNTKTKKTVKNDE